MGLLVDALQNFGLLALVALGALYLRSLSSNVLSDQIKKALLGVLFGIMIVAVMYDPIVLPEGATFDTRAGPAILAGVFGGPIAALVANAMGMLARYYLVGGPFAVGGVCGFAFYGTFGVLFWFVVKRRGLSLGLRHLVFAAIGGTVAVLPAFFIGVPTQTALAVLKEAGPLLVINNLVSTILVGMLILKAREWVEVRAHLSAEQAENLKLARVARTTDNSVILTDRSGAIEWVNEGFERLTGYKFHEVKGKKPGEFLQGPNTDQSVVKRFSKAVASRSGFVGDLLNYKRDGRQYWIHVRCECYTDFTGETKFLAVQNEITEQIKYEQELIVARDAAQSANNAKSQFLSTMSHELRTPLNAVIGFSDLIMNSADGQEQNAYVKEYAGHIFQSGHHLLSLVNQILEFSSLNHGSIELNREHFNLAYALDETINQFEVMPGVGVGKIKSNLQFRSDAVIGDGTKFRLVLSNLIDNALKFSDFGPVRVVGSSTLISHDVVRVEIHVHDSGIGVSDDQRELIFRPFTQADSAVARKYGGSGLGLPTCYAIAKQMGGTIDVNSQPGHGSVFMVSFNFHDAGSQHLLEHREAC